MARTARVVVPGLPHHVVQRGNRNQTVFFSNSDRLRYLNLLRKASFEFDVTFLSYCLMDNHVHLIAIPEKEDSLSLCFRKAHSIYSRYVNSQFDWRGHLWQNRFHSSPLGPSYLYNAIRYVEQNPVRAGIVRNTWDYNWSSAAFHTGDRDSDLLVDRNTKLDKFIEDWREYLSIDLGTVQVLKMRKAAKRNRPAGRHWFLKRMENILGIQAEPLKRGRPLNDTEAYYSLSTNKIPPIPD
ncbi:MAG: transposase [Candidatus Aegiribacteria sp.]|nr:transposase [Candidatus Aegiribacteria sp.]